MKLKRKIISFLLASAMALTSASAVFAADNFDKVVFDLQTYGIMTGDENGELNLDESVTRAEFSAITVRLLNMEDTVKAMHVTSQFSDVGDDHWAKNYIVYLSSMNVLNGTSATTFEPEGSISTAAAAKILVNTLGYNIMAENKGGYPSGYMAQAGELGLLTGVTGETESLSRRQVAQMVYNALDVDIMTITNTSGMGPVYEVQEGKTLRSMFKDSDNSILVKMEGVVTATPNAYIDSPVLGMESNEIEIDGQMYRHNLDSVEEFLGQRVYFYVYGANGTDILNIMASEDNETFDYPVKYLKTVEDSSISFYKGDNVSGAKTHRLDSDVVLVKNNQPVYGWSISDIQEVKRGNIKLIDNDDDGKIEVIITREYESVIVDEVMTDQLIVYLRDGFTVNGQKYIDLDPEENPNRNLSITYADGSPVNIADLKKGDVFTTFVSDDGNTIEIIVSQKMENAALELIGKDTVQINGTEYYLEDEDKNFDVSAGDTVKAYFNYNDEVVFMEKSSVTNNYAYVIKTYEIEEGTGEMGIKVATPGVLAGEVDITIDDDGKEVRTSKIACRNEAVKTFALADKVTFNGEKVEASKLCKTINDATDLSDVKRVISYYLDKEGKISRINTPEQIGTGYEKYYNATEMTFGKTKGGAFGVSEETLTLCVPKPEEGAVYNPSNDDYLVKVEMNNGQLYTIKAFDQNENTYTADLILVNMPMTAGAEGLVTSTSKVGMVTSASTAVNEDGDVVDMITMYGKDDKEAKDYLLASAYLDSEGYQQLKEGDVIAYTLDGDDQIDGCQILGRTGDDLPVGVVGEQTTAETFSGYLLNVEYNQVSENLNRWVNTLTVGIEPDGAPERTYEVFEKSPPPTFIYEKATGRITKADVKQIRLGSDKIFISAASGTVRAVVAIR